MSDETASASTEALVGCVHRLLNQSTTSMETRALSLALRRSQLNCLTTQDILALFQLSIERGSVDELQRLLALRLLQHNTDELTRHVLSGIVEEGDATLLDAFLQSQHVTITQDVVTSNNTKPILHIAVQQDNAELVAVLLKHCGGRLEVDQYDADGWTALHFAVEWDSVPVQTRLLQAGANINAHAKDGMTPVHLAVQLGFFESVRFLVESGADVSITDCTGATPLHTAAREGHTALVNYLLHHGAKLSARDAEGRTPLHAAAFYDESAARFARGESDTQVAVVRALLAHGADVHVRDAQGNTALHNAQQGRFDVIVDELLAQQAPQDGTFPAAA